MKKFSIYSAAGLLISMLVGITFSQNAYFGYTEEPINPRSVGMGSTGTAAGTGGFSFYNPAAIIASESSFVAFNYGRQWGERSHGLIETAWNFPEWFIGASFQTQSIDFQITDYTGSDILPGKGTEQASEFTLSLGRRGERYGIGVAANGLYHHIYDRDAYALSANAGVSFVVMPGKLTAGAALLQLGRLHKGFYDSKFEAHRDRMPTTGRIGGLWNDTLAGKLPVNIAVDVTYGANYEKITVPVGVELWPLQPLAIRIGKRFNFERDLLTMGIGIRWENIAFDAAFTPSTFEGDIDLKWLMGMRYSLAPAKRARRQPKPVKVPAPATSAPAAVIDSAAGLVTDSAAHAPLFPIPETIKTDSVAPADSIQPPPVNLSPLPNDATVQAAVPFPATTAAPADTIALPSSPSPADGVPVQVPVGTPDSSTTTTQPESRPSAP